MIKMSKFVSESVLSASDFNEALKLESGWEFAGVLRRPDLEGHEKGRVGYENVKAGLWMEVTAGGCSCGCILLGDAIDVLEGVAIEPYRCNCYEDDCYDCGEGYEVEHDVLIISVESMTSSAESVRCECIMEDGEDVCCGECGVDDEADALSVVGTAEMYAALIDLLLSGERGRWSYSWTVDGHVWDCWGGPVLLVTALDGGAPAGGAVRVFGSAEVFSGLGLAVCSDVCGPKCAGKFVSA